MKIRLLVIFSIFMASIFSFDFELSALTKWELYSKGEYRDFIILKKKNEILIAENILSSDSSFKESNIINVKFNGEIKKRIKLPIGIYYISISEDEKILLVEGDGLNIILKSDGTILRKMPSKQKTILLTDNLYLVGEGCTNDGGYYDCIKPPHYAILKDVFSNKVISKIQIEGELLDARLIKGSLFILSRGPINLSKNDRKQIEYKMTFKRNINDKKIKAMQILIVPIDDSTEDCIFIDNGLLLCKESKRICNFSSNALNCQFIEEVPFDSFKFEDKEIIESYPLLFKTKEGKFIAMEYYQNSDKEFKKLLEKFVNFYSTLKLSKFCLFTRNGFKYIFIIDNESKKVNFFCEASGK